VTPGRELFAVGLDHTTAGVELYGLARSPLALDELAALLVGHHQLDPRDFMSALYVHRGVARFTTWLRRRQPAPA
jgi:hypothetical protein